MHDSKIIKTQYVKGDALQLFEYGNYDVLVHGCNCFHRMGSGIAKQIAQRWPKVVDADRATEYGDINRLGSFTHYSLTPTKHVVNLYTQYTYGITPEVKVHYASLRQGLISIARYFGLNTAIIMPWIGCGLAGGDTNTVRNIVEASGLNITIAEL